MALTTNLVAWWKMEEGASSNRVDSVSGLVMTQSNSPAQATGLIGNAAGFASASSQRLYRADDNTFDPGTGDWSIQFWLYPTTISGLQWIWSAGALNTSDNGYTVYRNGATLVVRMRDGVGAAGYCSVTTAASSIAANVWHHVVAVFSRAGNLTVYINGSSSGTPASMGTYTGSVGTTQDTALGGTSSSALFLDGRLDMVGYWTRALSGAEVTELYNGGAGKDYPFAAGLLPIILQHAEAGMI